MSNYSTFLNEFIGFEIGISEILFTITKSKWISNKYHLEILIMSANTKFLVREWYSQKKKMSRNIHRVFILSFV